MVITSYKDFVNNYLTKNGMLGNSTNINRAPEQLKLEIDELNRTKVSYDDLDNLTMGSIINKPLIISPTNHTTDYIGAVTSTYGTNNNYEGLQTRVIWECALDTDFNDIIDRYEGSSNLTSWTPIIADTSTHVFVRTKQISNGYMSVFSDIISYTTPSAFVQAPTISISGILSALTPTINLSAFKVFNGSDAHISTDYQAVNKATGNVKWESLSNTANKLSITTGQLDMQTTYRFRARFNGHTYGSSPWVEIEGTTMSIYVVTPTLTVQGRPSNIEKNPTLTTSAFTVYNGSDTHLSTDYQVLKNSDGSIVWESLGNTANKRVINSGDLVENTEYRFRARHNSTNYGSSDWVEVIGTTKSQAAPTTGLAGTKGFSVAPTTQPFAVLGLSEMTGTNEEGHDNYGNYIHSNGSVVCWLPKTFYRVGHSSSPRFAKYGANALDMLGTDAFANEAAANASGYILHRCFINAGKEQPGVFVDKYVNTSDGNSSSKSIFGGDPISLVRPSNALAGWLLSGNMSGCTGILADAVVLSKSRGSRWNCTSSFIYGYLSLVSVAQAQAATSTEDVAWYDSTGVKNYPKGCNTASLCDIDDSSVVYASSGQVYIQGDWTVTKPKTGATQGFAKTTHNGSNNGVADLNGGLREVTIGITNLGYNATEYGSISNDTIYVLKKSIDIATLTAEWGGTTSAWGSATNLATKYDYVTSPCPIAPAAGAEFWGRGANAVFPNDLSGVNRDICGFLPKNSSSISATGANLFGNDKFGKYNRQNMVIYMSGFIDGSESGIFARYCTSHNSDNILGGFRASAYFA